MRSTYNDELGMLAETYQRALGFDIGGFVELRAAIAGQPTLFVASGGALAVAELAAERHAVVHGQIATAVTPLSLVGEGTIRHAAVVAISARAAHPDIGFALRAARIRHNYPVGLVTQRSVEELEPALVRQLTTIVHVSNLRRDGFIATNSVLALATLFIRASDPDVALPTALPLLTASIEPLRRPRCLILYGPGHRSAAIDLETRLSELGLSAAQCADYRNFAHGRHTGLARRLDETTVVAFASSSTQRLADATLSTLPDDAHVIALRSDLSEPVAALDLLVASMRLVGATAQADGIDAARPKVPSFGRRLYHLSARQHVSFTPHQPVDHKLSALGTPSSRLLRDRYVGALDSWLLLLMNTAVGGVVVDYDGTVCETNHRFELPRLDVQQQFLRLLGSGCHIGFATGRGRSLHSDLRRWLPKEVWPSVTVGLYNGYMIQGLDEPVRHSHASNPLLAKLLDRLEAEPLSELAKIEARPGQLSVEPVTGTGIGIDTIYYWLTECVARGPALSLKLLRSGHSVDVVDPRTTKVAVVEAVESITGRSVVCFGDRGEVGGNDFELLAARRLTLSVDRCSADTTRCWNLASAGNTGPDALLQYLRHIERCRDGWRLRLPMP